MPEAGAAQRGHRQIQRRQAADSRWDSPAGLPVGSTLRKQKEDGARFQAGIEPPSSFSSFFPPATRPWNAGVRPGLPARSPNLNAHLERFHRSLKAECLACLIFFGERPLRKAIAEFEEHYHRERNHQGLNNKLLKPQASVGLRSGQIRCRQRLGGLLKYYYRSAA